MRISTFALVAVALSLQACSGLRPVPDGPEAPPPEATPTYPAYEAFDPAGYDVEPVVAVEVVHDVPARVMQGRVEVPDQAGPPASSEPVPVQVEGFRVQVFTSASRETAEGVRSEAVAWWERAQSQPGAPESLEAVVAYRQPYYRVQLGAFATRDEADAALALVRRQYPEAFLVPDLVTVMR